MPSSILEIIYIATTIINLLPAVVSKWFGAFGRAYILVQPDGHIAGPSARRNGQPARTMRPYR
jgi:hypothetical protein